MFIFIKLGLALNNLQRLISHKTQTRKTKRNRSLKIITFQYRRKLLPTVMKGEPKAPLSISTTPWCKGGRHSISLIAPIYP